MISELFKAFSLIFIAEMGDKTQILAMAFSTKFPIKKVIIGIFIGSLLNHGLAVALGNYLSHIFPLTYLQITAGFAFIIFSLWTLKCDDEEGEHDSNTKNSLGPIVTVAIAFFIGELGDKTQLTAITLSTDSKYPLFILCGTVLGMVVTGVLGIVIGKKFGSKIPEFFMKIVTSSIFLSFGFIKLYESVPRHFMTLPNITILTSIVLVLFFILIRNTLAKRQAGIRSKFIAQSALLHDYYINTKKNIAEICLGASNCIKCKGNNCLVGNTKNLIRAGLNSSSERPYSFKYSDHKKYDKDKVIASLKSTKKILDSDIDEKSRKNINYIRNNLEKMISETNLEISTNPIEYEENHLKLNKSKTI